MRRSHGIYLAFDADWLKPIAGHFKRNPNVEVIVMESSNGKVWGTIIVLAVVILALFWDVKHVADVEAAAAPPAAAAPAAESAAPAAAAPAAPAAAPAPAATPAAPATPPSTPAEPPKP
jgi:hypothetical protein